MPMTGWRDALAASVPGIRKIIKTLDTVNLTS